MRKRLTYANVVATMALVFAMSGGALAASHYLVNSTRQINPKVLKKLKGATGKSGPAGAPGKDGAQGAEGKTGPSEAITSQTATMPFPESAGAADVIRSVTLGPGSYTLLATVTADNTSGAAALAECIAYDGAKTFGEGKVDAAAKSHGVIALSGVVTAASSVVVKLACKSESTLGAYEYPTLIATRVGALN